MTPTKYAKEAKRLGITEYNAKTSLKLDRKLHVDSIWVLDNWPAIEKALKREGIVVKARAIARMTKSAYHTILGMLVEEGELELATSFSKTIKAAVQMTRLPNRETANDMRAILLNEIGKPEWEKLEEWAAEWKTPNGGKIRINQSSSGNAHLVYCPKGKEWLGQHFVGVV